MWLFRWRVFDAIVQIGLDSEYFLNKKVCKRLSASSLGSLEKGSIFSHFLFTILSKHEKSTLGSDSFSEIIEE